MPDASVPPQPLGLRPLGPQRFDFHGLSADDFELLCFLAIALEQPDAIRLRAPDRGADAALPVGRDRRYERCWQCKRFGARIAWRQCVDSLARGMANYAPERYTFCFAADLTGSQEAAFKRYLVDAYPGVTIDWWGQSRLIAALVSSAPGQRIAEHFYGSPQHNGAALVEAIRAGGPFQTAGDAVVRLGAAASWLAKHDPFYSYLTTQRESDIGATPLNPRAIMAVERGDGTIVERIEVIPRNVEAIEGRTPGAVMRFQQTEAGAEAFRRVREALTRHESLNVGEGVEVEFTNLPEAVERFAGDRTTGEVRVTITPAVIEPLPWPATLLTTSSAGEQRFDIDLVPITPTPGWLHEFSGLRSGLRISIRLAETDGELRGQMQWQYDSDPAANAAENFAVTGLLLAVHQDGELQVRDRSGQRPPLPVKLSRRELPYGLDGWHRLLGELALIEEVIGARIAVPDDLANDDIGAVYQLAAILRSGESRMTFTSIELVQSPEANAAFLKATGPVRLATAVVAEMFGQRILAGYLSGEIVDWEISSQAIDRETGTIRLTITPTSEQSRNPVFTFSRQKPQAS